MTEVVLEKLEVKTEAMRVPTGLLRPRDVVNKLGGFKSSCHRQEIPLNSRGTSASSLPLCSGSRDSELPWPSLFMGSGEVEKAVFGYPHTEGKHSLGNRGT